MTLSDIKYFKVDDNNFIAYKDGKPSTIKKTELEDEKQTYIEDLASMPIHTDEFLLDWAKDNYPFAEDITTRRSKEDRIAVIDGILEALCQL